MAKKQITFTDEMERLIQKEAERRGAPFASVVREAIREWAERRGISLESEISWGGSREPSEDKSEGQFMAVASQLA
jgi:hypothetical protein